MNALIAHATHSHMCVQAKIPCFSKLLNAGFVHNSAIIRNVKQLLGRCYSCKQQHSNSNFCRHNVSIVFWNDLEECENHHHKFNFGRDGKTTRLGTTVCVEIFNFVQFFIYHINHIYVLSYSFHWLHTYGTLSANIVLQYVYDINHIISIFKHSLSFILIFSCGISH